MTGTWALIPAKGFDRGKSRLRGALDDDQRATLARALFEHVLDVARGAGVLAGVLVATDAAEVADVARARGARVALDRPGVTTLAEVVDDGLRALPDAAAALVLMADLPHLTVDDVRALVALLADHDVVLARAGDGAHTNALGLAPPTCLAATSFGQAESFAAHLAAARAAGLRVATVENPRIAHDVDVPADLPVIVRPPAA